MNEKLNYHAPGPYTKGGGFRGGPKRWNGGGPAPARHIPWPEIFKHHISLVEGHLKMVDMVRKHTVEGTGNYRTIMDCVNRCKDMLHEVKHISRSFVPPPYQREQVPLGSSSASMYPGYSPADHEYGKAAEEYGRAAAEAKAKGTEIKHPEVEYEIGQAKGIKRRTLAGIRAAKAARDGGSGSGTGSGSDVAAGSSNQSPTVANEKSSDVKVAEAAPERDNPFFVIDTKPTPVNLPGILHHATKRSASPPPEPVEAKKHKKAKRQHDGELPKEPVEFNDISKEVDARMKEKEEKRKRKEKKKRKRESEGEPVTSSVTAPETGDASVEVEKPKKKNSRQMDDEALADRTIPNKRLGEGDGDSEDGDGQKKKKRKKI